MQVTGGGKAGGTGGTGRLTIGLGGIGAVLVLGGGAYGIVCAMPRTLRLRFPPPALGSAFGSDDGLALGSIVRDELLVVFAVEFNAVLLGYVAFWQGMNFTSINYMGLFK